MGGVIPTENNISMVGVGLLGRTTSGAGKSSRLSAASVRSFCSVYSTSEVDTLLAGYQPLDSDLTAIAALTTTSFGRSLLTQADAAAVRTTIGAGTSSFDGAFSSLSGVPTTISGYGITNAYTKTEVDNLVAGLLDFKGNQDCSANPNYPSALKGDAYYVSVAGKIGGASGVTVAVGDLIVCSADNAGGDQASVGSSWFVLEKNLDGALVSSNNLSDLASVSTARSNLGLGTLATQSGTFSGTSSGTNTGDQTITLTGDVTGSGTGSFVATIGASKVTNAMLAGSIAISKLAITGTPDGTKFLRDDGAWAAASGGLTSLNSQTGSTQTFATGTSGTDFAISSATNTHTFNIPDAGASARGLVTTGSQTFAGAKTFSGNVTFSGGTIAGASNVLTLVNSTSAQTLNVANTFTSSTSFEYGRFQFASNEFRIGTAVGSAGGVQRSTVLGLWNSAGSWTAAVTIATSGVVTFGNTINISAFSGMVMGSDVTFARDTARTLELRSSTSAITFALSNTYTSGTNFEQGKFQWVTNEWRIGTAVGSGGGTQRTTAFGLWDSAGTWAASFSVDSSANLNITDARSLVLGTTTGTKIGTATTQKIGLWNATPIVQPTTGVAAATRVGGGGTALTDTDTFDGYTLSQVVKALRNMGALA